MLFMSVMVTTMMATACVLSFLEVEGEEEVGEWDHQEQDMAPPPGVQTTELLCQVGGVSPNFKPYYFRSTFMNV